MVQRDRVAIIGVGATDFGALYAERDARRSGYDLAAAAFTDALRDAGIERDAVDGLICARLPSYTRLASMLGIRRPSFTYSLDGAGRMSAVAVQTAAAAIEAGLAETVACVYGNDGRSAGATYGGDIYGSPTAAYDTQYGKTSPGAYVAVMYQRYVEDHHIPDLALAPLAINNRANAAHNPAAVMRKPLTIDEYASGRFITEPLRLHDYCLINDGGVALIMTSARRARALGVAHATISSTAACGDLTDFYASTDFFAGSCAAVADRVYADAGITRAQIDCAQIYDNFTPTVIFSLEGFGFCPPGTGTEWIKGGRIALDGELPVNTSGGHTSESYMQGWALHVEAVRQLRGQAGARQVGDCEIVQYICASPIVGSHILRRG